MFKIRKKILFAFLTTALLTLNACGNAPAINTVNFANQQTVDFANQQQIEAQSWKTGTVPDNGDINIKFDNLVLARRTFNNAPARMYIDGSEAFPAIERFIDNAKKSLYVETFIFNDDATGRRIAEKLVAKKKQGVDVKILIDALGLATQKGSSRIFDYFEAQKMDVKKYNKTLFGFRGINITHRKLLIADGDKGMTGGMNYSDQYAFEWHDSMTEVHGEVAQDLQREFFADWAKAGGKIPSQIPTLQPGKVYGNIPMRVVVTSAFESKKRYEIKYTTLNAIDSAKSKIRIEGPYFSDDDLIKSLKGAAKRGVKVEVILPKISDSKIYDRLNMGSAKELQKNGVKVYFYTPRFTHVKAAIIDNMTIIGSANADARSFRENQELNIIIEDSNFQYDVSSRLFQKDIANSSIENLESKKVGFGKKIANTFWEIVDYYL